MHIYVQTPDHKSTQVPDPHNLPQAISPLKLNGYLSSCCGAQEAVWRWQHVRLQAAGVMRWRMPAGHHTARAPRSSVPGFKPQAQAQWVQATGTTKAINPCLRSPVLLPACCCIQAPHKAFNGGQDCSKDLVYGLQLGISKDGGLVNAKGDLARSAPPAVPKWLLSIRHYVL